MFAVIRIVIFSLSIFSLIPLPWLAASPLPTDHGLKLDEYLSHGELAKASEHFNNVIAREPNDHQARAALGLTQFLEAIQWLGQSNYKYGLISKHASQIPIARLPISLNPNPEKVSYQQIRDIVQGLEKRLKVAEATLAAVDTMNLKLDLFIGRVRLDLNGDQVLQDEETLWRIFSEINRGVEQAQGENFSIGMDGADVHWLCGYCHVMMAFCDFFLAYDQQDLFERCGHLLFEKVESPHRVARELVDDQGQDSFAMISDYIAAIHLMKFRLIDPNRMGSAHNHLLQMIRLSRICWERANGETDNDREWIPNPNQDSILQLRVPREMVDGWQAVLDELEAVLEGRKLIPYWRHYVLSLFNNAPEIPKRGTGVNLKKFFLEPRDFDLVLHVQGSTMEPFLEEGPLSTPETWSQLTRVFRGQFFGFAIWFN